MQLLFLQQWFPNEVLKAIGWTLIHSLWQGSLAAVVAGIIIISTRRSEARIRYNLLSLVLVLFVITTVITFSQQLKTRSIAHNIVARPADPAGQTSFAFTETNFDISPVAAKISAIDRFVSYFNANADLFVLLWAIFFFVHCIKLLTGLAGIQRMLHYKTHASPEEWRSRLDQLGIVLGIKQTVGLLQSELIKVPAVIGILKPVILVPIGLLSHLPPEQAEAILLHELAHIRRNDYLVNILQRFTEAVFFFNPALLWISSLIRQEREACCDDIVVANTTHKGNYLEALVSFQEYSLAASGYAMAISSKRNYLLNRVKRMITHENKKLNLMEKLLLCTGLLVVTAFNFISQKEFVNNDKRDIAVAGFVKQTAASNEATNAGLSAPANKLAIKKENKKPVSEVRVNSAIQDTVPRSSKGKEKTGYDDLKFPGISSNVNNDGKSKTETTTVTDQDGKKYTYTKLNDKITSLTIDGKTIPENEIGNYSPLFDRIETVMQENRERRMADMEKRKLEMAQRKIEMVQRLEELKSRTNERKMSREYQGKLKEYLIEHNRRSAELQRRSQRSLEDQRRQLLRLYERSLRDRRIVPTINGREVILNNVKEYLKNIDLQKKQEISKDLAVKVAKVQEINKYLFIKNDAKILFDKKIDYNFLKPNRPVKKTPSPKKVEKAKQTVIV
jgi:bla regulator protein BlaR1